MTVILTKLKSQIFNPRAANFDKKNNKNNKVHCRPLMPNYVVFGAAASMTEEQKARVNWANCKKSIYLRPLCFNKTAGLYFDFANLHSVHMLLKQEQCYQTQWIYLSTIFFRKCHSPSRYKLGLVTNSVSLQTRPRYKLGLVTNSVSLQSPPRYKLGLVTNSLQTRSRYKLGVVTNSVSSQTCLVTNSVSSQTWSCYKLVHYTNSV